MATFLYDKGRQGFLEGAIDYDTDTVKAQFLDAADYTVNQNTHDNYDDVAGAARVGTATALAGKSVTDGVADASDLTINSVSGDESEAILLFKDTGVESTSRLIAYIDNYTGLPVTPNGGNITIAWPNDGNKIFKL